MITIYTPTYNRAYCLPQLYKSLVRQTKQSFEWLIIDDGSTDDTTALVNLWVAEASFKITYVKQVNEGKMAKLNYAHKIIETELSVCVDSDDYLTDDAIEVILSEWTAIKDDSSLAGLVGLDVFKNGDLVGNKFPNNITKIKYKDFEKLKAIGDKKFIYRTNILKNYPPYPSFQNEKFPAPGYLYRLIDVDYDLWVVNKPLCIVEYLEDGLSKNKYNQFKNAPRSFIFYRHERMRLATSFMDKFKNAIHYVSSCIFAKRNFFIENRFPATTFFALPFGVLLNVYIRKTSKKGVV